MELRHWLAAVVASRGDAEPRHRLHGLAGAAGAWDQLAGLIDDELRLTPTGPAAGALLAELVHVHLHQGRAAEADAAWRRLEVVAPNSLGATAEISLLQALADVYETLQDQPVEAIRALERLVERVSDAPAFYERLAKLYVRVGALAKAAAAFLRVGELAADPDSARRALHEGLALIMASGAAPEAALGLAEALAERFPGDARAQAARATLLERLGRYPALVEVAETLVAMAPVDAERAHWLRVQARAHHALGQAEAVAQRLAEASRLSPEDDDAARLRAEVLARAGRVAQAAATLDAHVARPERPPPPPVLVLELADLHAAAGDASRAMAALERLLEIEPGHEEALRRLVSLADALADPRAGAVARDRLADALPRGREARALRLAAARRLADGAGDFLGARARLEAVFAETPDDAELARELEELEARRRTVTAELQARAHLMAGRPGDAQAVLDVALAQKPELGAADRGLLLFLRGQALAQGGDADGAYRAYLEAHRLRRGDVLVRLALGEAAFEKRLWHEAALHLGALAGHKDAGAHAAAVARGLVHAAAAEEKALRPERAEVHYDAAARLDPACAAAWHGLAEIAMAANEVGCAADFIEREAQATSDPADRVRLYEALGDLALTVLGDPARAERSYGEAARLAPVLPAFAPLFEKRLALAERRGAHLGVAEACEALAELDPDPARRRARLDGAIDAYLAAGSPARARAAAARLADALPFDEAAVDRASALDLEAGDARAAEVRLDQALAHLTHGQSPRRAELWRRLGDARLALGDPLGAKLAFERAIATAPAAKAALAARRGLVSLGAAEVRPSIGHLRKLVEAEQAPAEILALAHELARAAAAGLADVDEARALFELAEVLGATPDEGDDQFLTKHPARALASDEAYAGTLDAEAIASLIADPDDTPLGEVLELLWEGARLLVSEPKTALALAGEPDAQRMSPVSKAAAAALVPQISKVLGGPPTLLYATSLVGAPELSLVLAVPPVILLGPSLVSQRARSRSDIDLGADAELRFRLGRVIEQARPRRVFTTMGGAGFARLVSGLMRAFGPPGLGDVDAAVAAEAERLTHTLPMLLRTRLAERLRAAAPEAMDPARFLGACQRAADRAGLLAAGHVGVAIRHAGGPAAARHLVTMAASTRYLVARRKLRTP